MGGGRMSNIKAFLHPTMLRTERSFRRLMKDLGGGIGYGVAIMFIEILSSEDEQKIPVTDIDLVADEIDISIPILNTIISKYNIFIVEDNYINCPMLDEWLKPFKQKIEQNRNAGKISAQKRKERARQQELQLLQDLSASNSIQQVLNTCSTNKRKEIKNTTTSCSLNLEEWLEEKCKNAKNPLAYKATLLQKYKAEEQSVLEEFTGWQRQKDRQKEIEKLLFFKDKKIILDNNIFGVAGVEKKDNTYTVHLQEPYQNSYRLNFINLKEIEKRIYHAS